MVLSEEQKKQLVERLKAGREAKKAAVAPPKKAEKVTKEAPPKPTPKAPPKPAPVENLPVIPFEEPLPPPVISDEQPKKVAGGASSPHPEEEYDSQYPTRKDKRLGKAKYMAIKFYEKPDPAIYKKVMRSVQESSSEDEPMELDYQAAPKVKITEAERARVAADIEAKKRDAIYKLLG